jgi:large subunit ribosomal protein L25
METQTGQDIMELKVQARPGVGKGGARKLRRGGMIPGVFYGSRHEPLGLAVDPKALLAALSTPKLKNTVIRLASDDAALNGRMVLVKDIQRHPLSRDFLHVDLMEVYADKKVRANIPVHVTGYAVGVDLGGTLEQHLRSIHIKVAADQIPVSITIDATNLNIGDSIKVSQLPVAPGVEVLDEGGISVVSVVSPRVVEEAKPTDEEAAAAAAAEGEAKPEGDAAAKGKEKAADKGKETAADKGKEKGADKDKAKAKEKK